MKSRAEQLVESRSVLIAERNRAAAELQRLERALKAEQDSAADGEVSEVRGPSLPVHFSVISNGGLRINRAGLFDLATSVALAAELAAFYLTPNKLRLLAEALEHDNSVEASMRTPPKEQK